MKRRFRLVDVFGERPLSGNPLAVVVDTEGLDTDDMLELTRWLGFSETTFLFPPDDPAADYRVRMFTLAGELPFAGHPTLGTCHVWLGDDPRDEVVQECGVGLVALRRSDGHLAFAAPDAIHDGPVDPAQLARFADVLGIDARDIVASRWVDNGPGWVGILLEDAATVLELQPDFSRHPGHETLDIGVVGFHPEGSDTVYEVRAFFSDQHGSMVEDPVTGSLNASVAQWLIGGGRVSPPYIASQGARLGRSGRIHISRESDTVWVGGSTTTMVSGELDY